MRFRAEKHQQIRFDRWMIGLRGVVVVAFGLATLVSPIGRSFVPATCVGVYSVFDGVVALLSCVRPNDD